MPTVPNQKIIHINREMPKSDFLQIKNENWKNASKDLDAIGLQLYLYFACNKDNFNLELSRVAVENAIGVKKGSYYKYIKLMLEKGYLVHKQGNIYCFYETPHLINDEQKGKENCGLPNYELKIPCNELPQTNYELKSSSTNREIDKINNIDIIDNVKYSKNGINHTTLPSSSSSFNF